MEEDSKWRSEEEEGEEEKGLMAFPLIAPLPTCIPTLHPCIQPPAPVWSHPGDPGGRAGTNSQPWMGTWMGPQSPRVDDLQTHPGHALTWAEHTRHPHLGCRQCTCAICALGTRWSPKCLLAPAQLLPMLLPQKRGFHSPPQGCARRQGAAMGAATSGCLWECSPPPAFCCQPPAAPWNPRGKRKSPPLPRPPGCPWAALCSCLTPTSLPPALMFVSP